MNEGTQQAGTEDRAWVVIQTRLKLSALRAFCRDLERLYRINPYLEFSTWRRTGHETWHTEFRNLSIDRELALDLAREQQSEDEFVVYYAQGLKNHTRFQLQATAEGSQLTITDDYSKFPERERQERAAEVDRSLPAWGQALYDYLRRHRRWNWLLPWRWYMRWMWVPMKPIARRVTWMIILINLAFFGLFLFVMLIYWIEHMR